MLIYIKDINKRLKLNLLMYIDINSKKFVRFIAHLDGDGNWRNKVDISEQSCNETIRPI